jgi:hypothetical protein
VREERLADLLGEVIRPIQIPSEVADEIATALRSTDQEAEDRRRDSLRQLDQRRRTVLSKLDRGYDDFLSGRISEEFWSRKSAQWEEELALSTPSGPVWKPRGRSPASRASGF